MSRTGIVDSLFRATRYAIRALLRRPLFTGVAVFTLAIGSGGTAAVFGRAAAVDPAEALAGV